MQNGSLLPSPFYAPPKEKQQQSKQRHEAKQPIMPPSPRSSSSSSPPPSSGGCGGRWGPYSGSSEFDIHMATILVILVLATIVAFTLHAALRFLLRLYRPSPPPPSPQQQHKQHKQPASSLAEAMPTLIFSQGTELAGGAECAICLTELAEGDRVRVLPACNHGFHVKCVEGWLVSKSSCPTCRASCRPPPVAAEP